MNSWALRSFRDVADGDYIAARMACRAQLPVQFLWASQQALEKYLKCILFLHRIPATGVRHDLRRALGLIANAGLKLDLNEHSLKFIQDVDDVGQYVPGCYECIRDHVVQLKSDVGHVRKCLRWTAW